MRLGLLQNLYPRYVKSFEEKYLSQIPNYTTGIQYLDEDSFSWNGVWAEPLSNHGIELFELFINTDFLNQLWAIENGLEYNKLTIQDLLIHQIKRYNLDVLIITDVSILGTNFIKRVRKETGILRIYAHICSPYYSLSNLKGYDGVFTCLKSLQHDFIQYGIPSFYLPHAFSKRNISKLKDNQPIKKLPNVLFAGGILKGKDLHDEREKLLLSFVNNKIPVCFYSEVKNYNNVKEFATVITKRFVFLTILFLRATKLSNEKIEKIPIIKKGLTWSHFPGTLVDKRLVKIAMPPLYGFDLYRKFSEFLVSLNIHAGIVANEIANMRLFEATGLGSCLLTDYKENLADFFELDKEVVAYKSIEEAVEKARYLISNPNVAIEIGKAAQKRVIRDHTFHNRSEILNCVFKNDLKKK